LIAPRHWKMHGSPSWRRCTAAGHQTPAELARDAATCGLSLEQVAEFAKRIERAKELEAALATRDQLRDEIERTGERFIAARQKLKEETTRLEGELRAARSAHLVAQDRLRHTDDAAVEIERLRRNHPALFSGAVPEFLRGLVE
jgi:hypothetical protein